MTKKLHFILLALFAVFNTAMAQEVTLDFTENTWGLPNDSKEKLIDAAQYTNGGYTITMEGSTGGGYYYHSSGKYVLIGKQGASLTLPAFNFDVAKIAVTGTSGASAAVKQNIFVGEEAISTETTGAKNVTNEYDIPAAYQAAGTIYKLQITSAHNTQITKIEIFKNGSTTPTKATPEMSFNPSSVSVTIGESVTAPTLSYNGDGAVTYASSHEDVATVDASTGALSILAVGTTTITATAAETANYKSASAQYTLLVKSVPVVIDDAIWSENWDSYEAGTKVEDMSNPAATYTGDDGQYVKLYANSSDATNMELLIPKSSRGLSFTANINLAGNSGNLTLTYYANKAIDVTTTTAGATVGEAAVADNTYTRTITVAAGTDRLILTFSMSTDSNGRLDNIVLVPAGEAVQKLTINGKTPFSESTEVTIVPSNPDYTVYYTLDGTNPGTSSTKQVYSAPFKLTATTTVKAVEEDYAENLSEVVEKTFVKEEAPAIATVANIADFKALSDGTEATLTLKDAYVLWVHGSDTYVRDASGAIDFYGTGITFTAGTKLNGSITGKRATYNKIPELGKTGNTNADGFTATEGAATAKTITLAQANGETYFCDLVKIEGVKIVSKEEGKYTNVYAYIGTDSVMVYDRFGIGMGNYNETDTYNVEGILVPFSGKYEIYITQPLAEGGGQQETKVCNNIAEFKALAANDEAELKLNNARVVYASGKDVYVRDDSGAIDFYSTDIEFEPNMVLNGSITGKLAFFRNLPELAKTDATNADKLTMTAGSEVQPTAVTVAQLLSPYYLCDLVELADVQIIEEEGKLYVTDGDDKVVIYDKYKAVGEDLVGGVKATIKAIHSVYNNDYQLLPLSYTITSGIHELTVGGLDPNAPLYNVAGQQVSADYKGIVMQKGKKFIKK